MGFTHCKGNRGVATIIGTMLLIAVTVVGGTITSVYTLDIFSSAQISGYPDIDFIQVLGYDTRDNCTLLFYGGFEAPCGTAAGIIDPSLGLKGKKFDERIAVYIVNHSSKKVLLSEIMFGGAVYNLTSSGSLTAWDDNVAFVPGQYAIMDNGNSLLIAENNEIQSGQTVTVVLDLESNYKSGRSTQMRITTGNNAVYASTIIIGEYKLG